MKTNKLKLVALLLVLFLCLGITTVRADDDTEESDTTKYETTIEDVTLPDGKTEVDVDVTVETEGEQIDETANEEEGEEPTVKLEYGDLDEYIEDYIEEHDLDEKDEYDKMVIEGLKTYDDVAELEITGINIDQTKIEEDEEGNKLSTTIRVTISSPSKDYAFATLNRKIVVEDNEFEIPYTAKNVDGTFSFDLTFTTDDLDENSKLDIIGTLLFKNKTNSEKVLTGIIVEDKKNGSKTIWGKTTITAPKGVNILNGLVWISFVDYKEYAEDNDVDMLEGYDEGAIVWVNLKMDSKKSTKVKLTMPVPEGYSNATPKMLVWNEKKDDYDEYEPIDYTPGYVTFEVPTTYYAGMSRSLDALDNDFEHAITALLYFQYGDNQQNKSDKDDTPHTGDVSTIYAIILATISLAGIVIVNRKK